VRQQLSFLFYLSKVFHLLKCLSEFGF
jgi:hypothetical protein